MPTQPTPLRAIGIMSGSSLDGVDAVRLATDGQEHIVLEASGYVPYPKDLRARVAAVAQGNPPLDEVLKLERALSELYVLAALKVMPDEGRVDVLGCHGQTIRHMPGLGLTWQLGDASFIAEQVGVPTVMDFRRRDMAAGGQGAPLVPLFHAALLGGRPKPCGILNLGGVANLTWFEADGKIRASDTGPGVGLLNSLCEQRLGQPFDKNGELAARGRVHDNLVERSLRDTGFWRRPLPRSADRYEFNGILDVMRQLNPEDAAATLCAITAAGVARTLDEWKAMGPVAATGGGSQNPSLMKAFAAAGVDAVDAISWGLRPQTMEAEAFAWLAARRVLKLPFSLPETTGAVHATVGGVLTV
ncbi:MAG TPA: anhydro-N-acetylmuramic acid kinase [Alphaproteobacteria bacterium]|nr:anhydro-N-acetylmuramic acid kinase [Alphaproteobacteria bacterium]